MGGAVSSFPSTAGFVELTDCREVLEAYKATRPQNISEQIAYIEEKHKYIRQDHTWLIELSYYALLGACAVLITYFMLKNENLRAKLRTARRSARRKGVIV